MRKRALVIVILAVILFAATSVYSAGKRKNGGDEIYRQVEVFSDALAIIRSEYVEDTKTKDLIYGALKGMLASLDPHSQFMDPETYNELKVDTEGKFGGVGIEITVKDGLLTVITPIEDTPAWKAGIKPGDRIVKIDNELTRDIDITDAVKKMRGRPGTSVSLTVLRDSEKKIMDFKITRGVIKVKDIKQASILEDGVGYIRLVEFRENTLKEFDNTLNNLSRQGMKSLILDLRNNPGGLLDVAVKITGRFLPPDKMIAYTKGRKEEQNFEFYSETKNTALELPMVVLINEGSASGSEIVAGVLQDYKRAIIIGNKSFGKGSVQTVIPLSDGSALRLTTSHYFTPSGKIIHGKGVTPDILVAEKAGEEKDTKDADYPAGPESIFDKIESLEKTGKGNVPPEVISGYKNDPQLKRAVDTLLAIELYKQVKK